MRIARSLDRPGYSALVLRRTFAELAKADSVIPRSLEWWAGTGADYNRSEHAWTFPSGARVEFGYLEHDEDRFRYQSAAYHEIYWEELTQHRTDAGYRYLFSRQRRPAGTSFPLFVGATFNPGGVGDEWVKARFLAGEMPEGRRFTSARLADNPSLDREEYERSLAELDPVSRAQLLEGDWDVSPEGRFFRREWFRFVESAPESAYLVRGWDTGASKDGDATAGVLLGVHGRDVYVLDVVRERLDVPEARELVVQTALADPPGTVVAVEAAHMALSLIQDIERMPVMRGVPLVRSQIGGRTKEERSRGWRARMGNGEMHLVRGPWNDGYVDELLRFTGEKGGVDDRVDATSVAFHEVWRSHGQVKEQKQIVIGSYAYYDRLESGGGDW